MKIIIDIDEKEIREAMNVREDVTLEDFLTGFRKIIEGFQECGLLYKQLPIMGRIQVKSPYDDFSTMDKFKKIPKSIRKKIKKIIYYPESTFEFNVL